MRCDPVQRELSARMDDAGDRSLDAAVEDHLAGCESCRRFRVDSERLRRSARVETAPAVPDLGPAIMAAVDAEPSPSPSLRTMRPAYRAMFVAVAGAAAVAVAALAISVGRPSPAERRTEAIRILRTRTLLAWTPEEVRPDLADRIEALEGVAAVARVRSGIVWLDGWTDSAGRRHQAPDGMRIPIEVAAIDDASYARFVPERERGILSRLRDGGVALGDGGAVLRGIKGTGELTFGRERLDVDGVVDDALVGAHEAVVSLEIGRRLSIDRVRYLLVALRDDASVDDIAGAIRGAVRTDEPIRVRALGESPYLRHGDVVLPQVRIKERFGEFAAAASGAGNLRVDARWTNANIVTVNLPVVGTVRCHRGVIAQMRGALREIETRSLVTSIDRDDFGGCFVPRYLSQDAGAGLSHHSWGIAFDLNVAQNAFGKPPMLDPAVVEVMERWGFTWGGRWLVPDGMHFEYVRTTDPRRG